jgi:hypothetical protein
MDQDNLRNGGALMDRLERYDGVAKMISGHVHRAITGQIGKVSCLIGPSTAHSVNRDLREEALHSLVIEPGGVAMHAWLDTPQPTLISDILSLSLRPAVWPF